MKEMINELDIVIINVCDWLNKRLNQAVRVNEDILVDMTKALAELITAKANLLH